ncbi:hypothetical protein CSUI_002773 [Cystoisospora suis]|uniref:Uncharacterized protein n=1 Tax=Cystoisospora suis TaxID=483139 RepID=A0A2C6L7J3_9APIC|nr:hypothetical protein CSUI_002773 [Cystoisospora suis]
MDSGVPTTPPFEGDEEREHQRASSSPTPGPEDGAGAPSILKEEESHQQEQEDAERRMSVRAKSQDEEQMITSKTQRKREAARGGKRGEQTDEKPRVAAAEERRRSRGQDEKSAAGGDLPTVTEDDEAEEKVVVLEYEPTEDPKTTRTGNLVVDGVNKLLDRWLAPGDKPEPARTETGPKEFRLVDAMPVPVVGCRGEPQRLGFCEQVKSLRFQCPHIDFREREERCPVCHQHMPGRRGPPPPPTWTQWLFKQCEEPVDLQHEFLVYPNPLVYVGYTRPNIDQPWFGTTGYVPS